MKMHSTGINRTRFSKKRFEAAKKITTSYAEWLLAQGSDPDLNSPAFCEISSTIGGNIEQPDEHIANKPYSCD